MSLVCFKPMLVIFKQCYLNKQSEKWFTGCIERVFHYRQQSYLW